MRTGADGGHVLVNSAPSFQLGRHRVGAAHRQPEMVEEALIGRGGRGIHAVAERHRRDGSWRRRA